MKFFSPDRIDMISTFFTRFIGAGLTFFTSIVIARSLGAEKQGQYALALSVIILGSQFINLGLQTANTYFKGKNLFPMGEIFANCVFLNLIFALVLAPVLWSIAYILPDWLPFGGLTLSLIWASILVFTFSTWIQSLLLAEEDFSAFNILDLTRRALHFSLVFFIAREFFNTVDAVLVAYLAPFALHCVLITFRLVRQHQMHLQKYNISSLKEMLKYGIFVSLAGLAYIVFFRIDFIVLSKFTGQQQTGYYSAAMNLIEGFAIIPGVVGMVLFAKLNRSESGTSLPVFVKKLIMLSLVLVPMFMLTYLFSDQIIVNIYGEAFLESSPVLKVLLSGGFFLCLTTLIQNFLGLSGKTHTMLWGPAAALMVKFILMQLWGVRSAGSLAYITSIGLFVWLITCMTFLVLVFKNTKNVESA